MLNWSAEEFANMINKAFIWDNTEYCRVIKLLSENLKPEQFKVIFFEDLHANPLQTLRDLENFLEIRRHNYNQEHLTKRINVSTQLNLPENFAIEYKAKLMKEAQGLIDLGYSLPASWNNLIG